MTARTEPEMYQRASSAANAIRPVLSEAKMRSTDAFTAWNVARWRCGSMAGAIVLCQTCSSFRAPSIASPSRVSGISAFSTANAIAPAWSSSLWRANRSIQMPTNCFSRFFTGTEYPDRVFDTLSDRLQGALGDLRKRGRLDEEAISRAMREVRLALLEADVNFDVVKDFVARVREQALGQEVLKSVTPGQQVVKIVHDELTALMGSGDSRLAFASRPPTVILLAGLQGSGKTTAAAKLALLLRKEGRKPASSRPICSARRRSTSSSSSARRSTSPSTRAPTIPSPSRGTGSKRPRRTASTP